MEFKLRQRREDVAEALEPVDGASASPAADSVTQLVADLIVAELQRLGRAASSAVADVLADAAPGVEDPTLEHDDGVSDAPIVRLVNSVLMQAAEDGASDVHFEPQEESLVVRFRIDGVL